MKYFRNYPYTAESLKAEFRALCLTMHPDKGGNAEEFKAMSAEYEQTARNLDGTKQNRKAAEDLAEAMRRAAERMRQQEEERREAERQAEEARRRYEREKEEERKRREAARPAYEKRCKKWAHLMEDLEPYAAAVSEAFKKESEAGRAHGWRSAEYKTAEKATRAARTAENAARRRNLLKMAQTAFKGVKFSLKYDNGWGGGYTVSWEDGPSVQEMEAATDYDLFVSMWDTFDGMTDCAGVESAMFTDFAKKYSGKSGKVEFSRTISEANRKKLEDVLIKFAPDLGKNDDPETRKRYNLASDWDEIKVSLDADKLREILRIFGADFDELNEKDRAFRYMWDYSSYTLSGWVKNLAEYLTFKTDAEKKEEKQAQPAQFAPRYGATLRTLHKLMGITLGEPEEGKKGVYFWQRVKTGTNIHEYRRFSILEAVEKLEKGEALKFGTFRDKSEKYAAAGYGTYNGGYKVQKARAEKFAAAGYEIKGAGYSGTNDYVSVSGIKAETAAAIREELADIERQRQEWERKQNEPKAEKKATKGEKASKPTDSTPAAESTATANGSEPQSNGDGLRMEKYSEKATVIRGYNAEQAAELEAMGGKEWRNLKGGKGFIFSTRRHGDKLREWFEAQQAGETAQAAAEPEPEPQTADTLEQAPEITDTNDSDTAAASEDTQTAEEPKQEEKRDELKQWHVEELIKGELRKHHLFTDDRNEAAEYMAAKLEELQQAEGVEILSTKKGRVIWYEGGKYHLLYIWNLDESRSMYWMARDSERRRVLNNLAERHAAAMKRKAEQEAQQTATASAPADEPQTDAEPTDTAAESAPLEGEREISALFEAVADFFGTLSDIMQQAKQWEGVTVPAATLARWKQEATEGTKTAAARLCEVCACLASLTPDSRRDFDVLGAIFWSLSEQIRNGYDPDTLQAATDYARAQLFDLIDRTQTANQARAVREANGEDNEQRKAA